MKVRVKYLAAIADYTGVPEEEIEIDDGYTLEDLLNKIRELHPELKKFEDRFTILVLVNGVNRGLDYRLGDGDRVALLPPVSGG